MPGWPVSLAGGRSRRTRMSARASQRTGSLLPGLVRFLVVVAMAHVLLLLAIWAAGIPAKAASPPVQATVTAAPTSTPLATGQPILSAVTSQPTAVAPATTYWPRCLQGTPSI